jgi:hypothetical protein
MPKQQDTRPAFELASKFSAARKSAADPGGNLIFSGLVYFPPVLVLADKLRKEHFGHNK